MSEPFNNSPSLTGRWQRAASFANLLDDHGALASTIFSEMSLLAQQTGAINLGQGFPDEDGPAEVLDAAKNAIDAGVNQYSPGQGLPDLRLAISEHQHRFYGIDVDPDAEVLVTAGATEAMAATVLALAGPGDEVLTFEPFYDAYAADIGMSGATHTTVPLHAPSFQPDLEELERTVTDRTRLIIVNDPNNPTGAVFSRATLQAIVDVAARHGAWIVTDEVYEHLVFGVEHIPIATLPGARERTISISSAGKTFSLTGWKIGWLIAPHEVLAAIRTVKQYLTFVNGAPFQPAIAAGLRLNDDFYAGVAGNLQQKRDILIGGLERAGFHVYRPQGTYFVVADGAPLGFRDGTALCRELPERVGVVGVPVSAFCKPESADEFGSLVRFAFCKKDEVLTDAAERFTQLSAVASGTTR